MQVLVSCLPLAEKSSLRNTPSSSKPSSSGIARLFVLLDSHRISILLIFVFCIIRSWFMCMKNFNEVIANHPSLESILIPIGDRMTVSKVKK